jgi:hypothetical protein
MTRYERMTLGSLLLVGAAYIAFFLLVTDDGLLLADMPRHLLGWMLSLLLALVVGHVVLWVAVWSRRGADGRPRDAIPDEREDQIDLRADRWAYFLGETGLFLLLVVAGLRWAGYDIGGSFSPTTPQGLVFAIVTLSSGIAIARQAAGLILSRRAGA